MPESAGPWYVTFPSTFWALRAEKALTARGWRARLRPVPRALSSSCGLALEVRDSGREAIVAGLEEEKVRFEGVYLLPAAARNSRP